MKNMADGIDISTNDVDYLNVISLCEPCKEGKQIWLLFKHKKLVFKLT
jgi:hypothetical protein